ALTRGGLRGRFAPRQLARDVTRGAAALQSVVVHHLRDDLLHQSRMLFEVGARVVSALPDTLAVDGEPRPALLDDVGVGSHIHHLAGAADALAVQDVELYLAEG